MARLARNPIYRSLVTWELYQEYSNTGNNNPWLLNLGHTLRIHNTIPWETCQEYSKMGNTNP